MKHLLATVISAAFLTLPAYALTPVKVETTSWGVNAFFACQQAVGSSVATGTEQCREHNLSVQSYTVTSTTILDLFHCSASVTLYCK